VERRCGPNGRDYQNRIVYLEVIKPERLVYTNGGEEDVEPVSFEATVSFAEQNGKTRLTCGCCFRRPQNATAWPRSMEPSRVRTRLWRVWRST
jgi:uncharacterized protein YndB with AHSA1/START domain